MTFDRILVCLWFSVDPYSKHLLRTVQRREGETTGDDRRREETRGERGPGTNGIERRSKVVADKMPIRSNGAHQPHGTAAQPIKQVRARPSWTIAADVNRKTWNCRAASKEGADVEDERA